MFAPLLRISTPSWADILTELSLAPRGSRVGPGVRTVAVDTPRAKRAHAAWRRRYPHGHKIPAKRAAGGQVVSGATYPADGLAIPAFLKRKRS